MRNLIFLDANQNTQNAVNTANIKFYKYFLAENKKSQSAAALRFHGAFINTRASPQNPDMPANTRPAPIKPGSK